MRQVISGVRGTTFLVVVALLVLTVGQAGYGQNASGLGQSVQCQPFQTIVRFDIVAGDAGSTGAFRVAPGTKLTIEEIALRIDAIRVDATEFVSPNVASITTTVGSVTAAYYVRIPSDSWLAIPPRPLTFTEMVRLHADAATNVTLLISVDPRYANGNGRAEWSVSGVSCPA